MTTDYTPRLPVRKGVLSVTTVLSVTNTEASFDLFYLFAGETPTQEREQGVPVYHGAT